MTFGPNMIIRFILLIGSLSICSCVIVPLPFTSDKSPEFRGKVVDSVTKKPVVAAHVWANGGERHKVATNQDGDFIVKPRKNFHLILYQNPSFGFGLPNGSRTEVLMLEAPGYHPLTLDFGSDAMRDKYLAARTSQGYSLGPFYHEQIRLKPIPIVRNRNANKKSEVERPHQR